MTVRELIDRLEELIEDVDEDATVLITQTNRAVEISTVQDESVEYDPNREAFKILDHGVLSEAPVVVISS